MMKAVNRVHHDAVATGNSTTIISYHVANVGTPCSSDVVQYQAHRAMTAIRRTATETPKVVG
eukprot:m.7274 g.7274  ORF g.7274 m.7274 type:complete len:62 (+) comp5545_c1_seq1:246-431(+)